MPLRHGGPKCCPTSIDAATCLRRMTRLLDLSYPVRGTIHQQNGAHIVCRTSSVSWSELSVMWQIVLRR
jgi:hypothetical protein